MIRYIGISAPDALRSATSLTGSYMADGGQSGALAVGKNADILVVDGNPFADTACLLDATRIHAVILGGRPMAHQERVVDAGRVSDFSQQYWNDLYTRERVAKMLAATPAQGRA
jgi:cytosine/adenosine deaminase-related metal-dependent hydrolase